MASLTCTLETITTTEFNDSPALEATPQVSPIQGSACFPVPTTRLSTVLAISTSPMMEITGFRSSHYRELSSYLGKQVSLEVTFSIRTGLRSTMLEMFTLQIITTVV